MYVSVFIYLINLTNGQAAFVPRDCPIYFRIESKTVYYFRIGQLSTCALNDARK